MVRVVQCFCDLSDPHLSPSLQVELDHARLAMLAVLLSGAVGAGAGVPPGASFMDAQHGFAAVSAGPKFAVGDELRLPSLPLAVIGFASRKAQILLLAPQSALGGAAGTFLY